MNLLKVQNQLRSVPDDALINYVQNPQPNVPSYLALSELQRRQEMREQYQGQQPESSVAEDVLGKEQQGGLAAMLGGAQPQIPQQPEPVQAPQPTMMAANPQQPTMMAEGGLASLPVDDDLYPEEFAGGGMVAFAGGGDVPSYAGPEGSYVSPKKFRELTIEEFNSLVPYAKEQYLKEYGPPTRSSSAEKSAAQEKGMSVYDKVQQDKVRRIIGLPDAGTPPKVDLPPSAKEEKPKLEVLPNPPAPAPASDKKRQVVTPPPIAPSVDVPARRTTFEPQPERSIGDYAKELSDYLGPDTSRAEGLARIAKMEEQAQKQKDVAPWMALAEAGFGIASGSSPFALQNIGTGALLGIKSYGAAQKDYQAQLEKANTLRNEVAKAERAEKVAIGKFGADSKEAQRERDFKERLQSEKNAVDYDLERMQQEGLMARTRETIAGQERIADKQIAAGRFQDKVSEKGGWTNKQLYDLREGLRDQARKEVMASPEIARLGEKQRLLPQNQAMINRAIEERLNQLVNSQIQGVAETRYGPSAANVTNPLGNMSYSALLGLTGGTK
jgi:hypothetical protein